MRAKKKAYAHDVAMLHLTPFARNIALMSLMVLLTTACAEDQGNTATGIPHSILKTPPPQKPVVIDPALADVKVKPEWLEQNCNASAFASRGTPPEFRACVQMLASNMEPIDPNNRHDFGLLYNPGLWQQCRLKEGAHASCGRYALRRLKQPEYWPYPDVPKPVWPEPEQRAEYVPGMTSEEYFKELCDKEAGEFIYKTVENVKGIYQIRPRANEDGDDRMTDAYVLEDPYGYTQWEADPKRVGTLFVSYPFRQYTFFESIASAESLDEQNRMRFQHQWGYENRWADKKMPNGQTKSISINKSMNIKSTTIPEAQYGYIWRGISRPYDRELGIAGGELMVVDLTTSEVLAHWRGFQRSPHYKDSWSGVHWMTGQVCPEYQFFGKPGHHKDWQMTYELVKRAVKPVAPEKNIK